MLRPLLYKRLAARMGAVRIAHEGEAMNARPGMYQGRRSLQVNLFGEMYRVSCPFCSDTRFRLWINHMWGYYNVQTGSRNLWLARCYNEDCLRDYANVRRLDDEIWRDSRGGRFTQLVDDKLLRGTHVDPDAMPTRAMPPGELIYLHELEEMHPAREYMRGRGYDPDLYSRELGVSYCPLALPHFSKANRRLIIPMVMAGELVGWQARLIEGEPTKINPKYIMMTGMKKSLVLYNYDQACHAPYVVVQEGATKVWRYGREAVAILGKKASGWQTQKLAFWGIQQAKPIVIMLDSNAHDEAQELYDGLNQVPKRVLVLLKPGREPDDMETGEARDLVWRTAREQGVYLPR